MSWAECLLRVIFDRSDQSCLPVYVCFALKADLRLYATGRRRVEVGGKLVIGELRIMRFSNRRYCNGHSRSACDYDPAQADGRDVPATRAPAPSLPVRCRAPGLRVIAFDLAGERRQRNSPGGCVVLEGDLNPISGLI
jgi:hypothetical protein